MFEWLRNSVVIPGTKDRAKYGEWTAVPGTYYNVLLKFESGVDRVDMKFVGELAARDDTPYENAWTAGTEYTFVDGAVVMSVEVRPSRIDYCVKATCELCGHVDESTWYHEFADMLGILKKCSGRYLCAACFLSRAYSRLLHEVQPIIDAMVPILASYNGAAPTPDVISAMARSNGSAGFGYFFDSDDTDIAQLLAKATGNPYSWSETADGRFFVADPRFNIRPHRGSDSGGGEYLHVIVRQIVRQTESWTAKAARYERLTVARVQRHIDRQEQAEAAARVGLNKSV